MKAYGVEIPSDDDTGDYGTEIIWAKNSKEARKQARFTEIAEYAESFIDFRVRRIPCFDDCENLSKEDFAWKQYQEGTEWLGYSELNEDDLTKEQFIERWKGIYEN